ncbi:MAG: ATP-binding protein [Paludibacteraceae bacterium]|nr:ATP-binding protein [Paludibacteraceae bacterium]
MEELREQMKAQLQLVSEGFVRYLHDEVDWEAQLIAILGARGVGKTTMLLQHIKRYNALEDTLFVYADNIYFTQHTLFDLAFEFYKNGGRHLYIDEIHKYKNWSQEIKNIYDSLPRLQVIYTGSSILDLEQGGADLSRRKLQYYMYGLSFREYLQLKHNTVVPVHKLEDLIQNNIRFPHSDLQPLPAWKSYVQTGYYPFFMKGNYLQLLNGVMLQTVENDIPMFAGLSMGVARKLKTLLYIIAQSVPFKPNMSAIAADLGISRNDVGDLFFYLEKAGLINQLRSDITGIRLLGKVDKVYLNNTNLMYAIAGGNTDIGNERETAFYTLARVTDPVTTSSVSDFQIGDYTFEVGGKKKGRKQIEDVENGIVVKDDIEYGSKGIVPLWAFGLMY